MHIVCPVTERCFLVHASVMYLSCNKDVTPWVYTYLVSSPLIMMGLFALRFLSAQFTHHDLTLMSADCAESPNGEQ